MSSATIETLDFYRVVPGEYACGDYTIKREATTSGMKRASNPMWFVYFGGERLGRHTTLTRAKRGADRHNAKHEAAVVETRDLPVATDGTVMAYDGMVVLTAADWAVVAGVIAAAREARTVSAVSEAHLAAMSLVDVAVD